MLFRARINDRGDDILGADETEVEPMHLEGDQQLVDRFHADHVRSAVVVALHQRQFILCTRGTAITGSLSICWRVAH
jgi:hypothetical protein